MDIEYTHQQLPSNHLFKPIEEFPIEDLYQQPVALENTFTSTPNTQEPSILLTLINNTLLLSDPNSQTVTPHAAINFNFDLKF